MKKAIVTGALGGIGTAITQKLLHEGYFVVAIHRPRTEVRANEWIAKNFSNEKSLKILALDVANFEMCVDVCNQLIRDIGNVDVLVNNAGVTRDSSFRKMTVDDWEHVININLASCFNMSKAIFDSMINNGFGRIINISSVNGQKGQFGQANYSASKSGIYGLTKSIALEGARKNITCNSVSPGYIDTEMTQKISPEVIDKIVSEIPVGRFGKPEEVAEVVAFLAREESSFITGANIAVNGGQHMY